MATARVINRDPMHQDVYADGAVAFTLPSAKMPIPLGFVINMIDNKGTFNGTNMVVSGTVDGTTSVTLSTNYQMRTFTWAGSQWI
jgi:hypothetical protein